MLYTHLVLYALRISKDAERIQECIASYSCLFDTGALFNEVDYNEEIEEKQHEFMHDAILMYAKNYHGILFSFYSCMNRERTQQLMMSSQGVRHSSAFRILWPTVLISCAVSRRQWGCWMLIFVSGSNEG